MNAESPYRREVQALLDACVDAVIIIDHRGHIQTFNHAAERLFGWSGSEILGQNIQMLMPEPDRSRHDGYLKRYMDSRAPHVIGIGREVQAMRRDGSQFLAALAVGEIQGVDPPRFVGFVRDLTAREKAETQRKQAEEAVREARERMMHVARLSTMGEMANGLAHELNQPLTAIASYAQAAERIAGRPGSDTEAVVGALRHITTQAMRAGEVIKRLRALVRNRESHEELVDVSQLLADLIVLADADARASQVKLVIQLGDDRPVVLADSVQLQQVLLNLIRNAIEAVQGAPPAGREIVLSSRLLEEGLVEVSVCDQGPGVPLELRERIFDTFFTTKREGTGLGLAISRTIIENHGGKLGWRANQPQGSCFHFSLPAIRGKR